MNSSIMYSNLTGDVYFELFYKEKKKNWVFFEMISKLESNKKIIIIICRGLPMCKRSCWPNSNISFLKYDKFSIVSSLLPQQWSDKWNIFFIVFLQVIVKYWLTLFFLYFHYIHRNLHKMKAQNVTRKLSLVMQC